MYLSFHGKFLKIPSLSASSHHPHLSQNPMHYIHSFKESTELMVSLNKARSLTY